MDVPGQFQQGDIKAKAYLPRVLAGVKHHHGVSALLYFRILLALDRYSQTADLSETSHTQLVQPLIALDVRDLLEDNDVVGFGSLADVEFLDSSVLVELKINSEDKNMDVSIRLSTEVVDRAHAARGTSH